MAETKFYLKVVDQATGPIKTVKNEFQGLFASMKNMTGAMASFQGMMAFYMSGMLVRNLQQFGQAFIDTASKFENMQRRFKAMGGPDYTQDVIAFAKRNPIMGIQNTQEAFVKLYSVGIDPTSKALQSLANAGNAFALSQADMGKVMLAIGQMAGKGVINMEELRQQLGERIPTAVKIMARELGYGGNDLKKFFKDIEQGRISAREGLTALFEGLSKDYSKSTEEMVGTWTWLMASMELEWEIFKKDFMSPEMFQKVKDLVTDMFNAFRENKEFMASALEDAFFVLQKIANVLKIIITEIMGVAHAMSMLSNAATAGASGIAATINNAIGETLLAIAGNQQGALAEFLRRKGSKAKGNAADYTRMAEGSISAALEQMLKSAAAFEQTGASARSFIGMKPTKKLDVSVVRPETNIVQDNNKSIFFPGESIYPTLEGAPTTYGPWAEPGKMEKMRQGFQMTLEGMIADFKEMFNTFEKIGAYAAKTISEAMANSFNDFFIDAMEGRLKQFKDYLLGFFKEIGAAISRLLSQYLAQQLLGSALGSFGGGTNSKQFEPGASGLSLPNSPSGASVAVPARMKGGVSGATSSPNIQIINNSGTPLQGSASTQTNDIGETVMVIVLDAIGRNKGGSRDMLRGMLAT